MQVSPQDKYFKGAQILGLKGHQETRRKHPAYWSTSLFSLLIGFYLLSCSQKRTSEDFYYWTANNRAILSPTDKILECWIKFFKIMYPPHLLSSKKKSYICSYRYIHILWHLLKYLMLILNIVRNQYVKFLKILPQIPFPVLPSFSWLPLIILYLDHENSLLNFSSCPVYLLQSNTHIATRMTSL